MSLFSGLAGCAADLLNKLDENAAQTLNDLSTRRSVSGKRDEDLVKEVRKPTTALKKSTPEKQWRTGSLPAKTTSLKTALPHKAENETSPKPKTGNTIRKLSNKPPTPSKGPKKGTASLVEALMLSEKDTLYGLEDTHSEGTKTLMDLISAEEPQKDRNTKKHKKEHVSMKHPETEDKLTSLESENKMLQNELYIINDQVSILVQKAKNVEKLNEALQKKVYDLEKNYNEAIKEKDLIVTEVDNYKKMIHSLQTISSPDTSKLETALELLKGENRNLSDKVKDLEKSNNKLELTVMSTTSLKAKLENDLRASQYFCSDLETQLTQNKEDVCRLEKDLEAYKIRAKGLLVMKEKIIEEMQNNDLNDGTKVLITQIDQLKSERDELLQTMSKLTTEYEVMRRSARQTDLQRGSVEKSNSALRDAIRQERSAREKAEHALSSLTRELKSAQIETSQQLAVLRAKLRDRDSELQRYQLSQATSYTTGVISDTETCSGTLNVASSIDRDSTSKVHRLTQALVSKQAALDSMMADRNALRLQLEKTETKYRSDLVAAQNNRLTSRVINVYDNVTDDGKKHVKASSRHDVKKQNGSFISNTFRNAYMAFWTSSVKIGIFLRKHPMMRIMIFGYMALLHLWVLIVIVTYSPEMHPV